MNARSSRRLRRLPPRAPREVLAGNPRFHSEIEHAPWPSRGVYVPPPMQRRMPPPAIRGALEWDLSSTAQFCRWCGCSLRVMVPAAMVSEINYVMLVSDNKVLRSAGVKSLRFQWGVAISVEPWPSRRAARSRSGQADVFAMLVTRPERACAWVEPLAFPERLDRPAHRVPAAVRRVGPANSHRQHTRCVAPPLCWYA
jgi:hypothetical protein